MENEVSDAQTTAEATTPPISLNAKLCMGFSVTILALGLIFTTGIGGLLWPYMPYVLGGAVTVGVLVTLFNLFPMQFAFCGIAGLNLGYWHYMTFQAKNVVVPPLGVAVILIAEVIVGACYAFHFRPKNTPLINSFAKAYLSVVGITFGVSFVFLMCFAVTNVHRKEGIALESFKATNPSDNASQVIMVEGSTIECKISTGKPVCERIVR
jgi:hypothetical protein